MRRYLFFFLVSRGPGELSPILPDRVACFAMLGGGEERDQAIGRGIVYPALYCGSLCSLVLCPDLLEPYGYFLHLKRFCRERKKANGGGGGGGFASWKSTKLYVVKLSNGVAVMYDISCRIALI